MTTLLETKLHIDSWDEKPYREVEDGSKFTRAAVTITADGPSPDEGITQASFDSLMFYRADGTSQFVVLMEVTAVLEGRSGTFALSGHGGFDGQAAQMELTVIEGSATGDLDGLAGTLQSSSTHADYPNMPLRLHYDLS